MFSRIQIYRSNSLSGEFGFYISREFRNLKCNLLKRWCVANQFDTRKCHCCVDAPINFHWAKLTRRSKMKIRWKSELTSEETSIDIRVSLQIYDEIATISCGEPRPSFSAVLPKVHRLSTRFASRKVNSREWSGFECWFPRFPRYPGRSCK